MRINYFKATSKHNSSTTVIFRTEGDWYEHPQSKELLINIYVLEKVHEHETVGPGYLHQSQTKNWYFEELDKTTASILFDSPKAQSMSVPDPRGVPCQN